MYLSTRIFLLLNNRRASIVSRTPNECSEETEPQADPTAAHKMADPFYVFLTGGTAHNMPANTTRVMLMARERNDAAAATEEYATARKGAKAELKASKKELQAELEAASKKLDAAHKAEWGSKPKDKRKWLIARHQQQQQQQQEQQQQQQQGITSVDGNEAAMVAQESQPFSREPSATTAADDGIVPEGPSAADQSATEQACLDMQLSEVYERATRAMADLRAILDSPGVAQRFTQAGA
ncbi:hypothetical protein PpBr36_05132 [Pyricularia pennisetigena]|uniref:hypothetical protein n=1 Tax=Pyricularia pennisetigena TaxID=1578925 RepID=UPI0011502B9B